MTSRSARSAITTTTNAKRKRFQGLDRGASKRHSKDRGEGPMDKYTTLEGVAAPLRIVNVDTDMIIPKQYLKTLKRTGLAKGLFSEMRYLDNGSENPEFVLNK